MNTLISVNILIPTFGPVALNNLKIILVILCSQVLEISFDGSHCWIRMLAYI